MIKVLWCVLAIWGYFIIGNLFAHFVCKLTGDNIEDCGGVLTCLWPFVIVAVIVMGPFMLISRLFDK